MGVSTTYSRIYDSTCKKYLPVGRNHKKVQTVHSINIMYIYIPAQQHLYPYCRNLPSGKVSEKKLFQVGMDQ